MICCAPSAFNWSLPRTTASHGPPQLVRCARGGSDHLASVNHCQAVLPEYAHFRRRCHQFVTEREPMANLRYGHLHLTGRVVRRQNLNSAGEILASRPSVIGAMPNLDRIRRRSRRSWARACRHHAQQSLPLCRLGSRPSRRFWPGSDRSRFDRRPCRR
jgi:hypothetical protein